MLRHVGIVCKDLEKSIDFYSKWFECIIFRSMEESGDFISQILGYEQVEVITVKLQFKQGESQIELLFFNGLETNENFTKLKSVGISHFAVTVNNIDFLYQKMFNDNVIFISKPKISDDGMVKVCFCKDPNGVYIEMVEIIKHV